MSNVRQMLTAAQAAEQLGVAVRTVHRMVERGEMKAAAKLPGDTGAYLFTEVEVRRVAGRRGAA